ncbi:MAG: NUDIX hydrolase [Pirellulales bacterium]
MPTSPADRPEILLETPRFRVAQHTVAAQDGTPQKKAIIHHPGSIVVLPWTEDGRVVLISNRRISVGAILWELCAGTLEPPEPPAACAIRELREETGYTAARWEKLGEFWMSPGILEERMHAFVVRDLTPGRSALEAGEEIETHVMPWTDALAMIDRGEIEDAKTIAVLLLWDRRLRATGEA